MPLPSNKGDLKASAYITEGGSYGFQCSYAMDSHIVVLADGAIVNYVMDPFNQPWSDGPYILTDKVNSGDLGVGYYTKFGKYGRFEAIGGLGYGFSQYKMESDAWGYSKEELQSNYFRAFGRADIGIVNNNAELGFGIGFSSLYSGGNFITNAQFQNLTGVGISLEPGLQLAVGLKNVKIICSTNLSVQVLGPFVKSPNEYLYNSAYFSAGMSISIFGMK
jgi:hypothetical protein